MEKNPDRLMYGLISRKYPAFTIAFAVILLSIFAAIISTKNDRIFQAPQRNTSPAVEAGRVGGSPPVLSNEMPETEEDEEDEDPLIPPLEASKDEIEWLRKKLPYIEILKSNQLSGKFHSRVLELFNKNCSARFFMIWFSPAESFRKRGFMAVDSLFNASPDGCLVILSSSMGSPRGYSILKPLRDCGFNIVAVAPDLPFLVKSTPAEAWLNDLKSGNVDPGSIPLIIYLSDLIRLTVLYKYGGVYLDTDIIIPKDLSGLKITVGPHSMNEVTRKWSTVNNAVMTFDIKHPLLADFLQEHATTFDGSRWGNNGPRLISKVLGRVGDKSEKNITILPLKAFYLVNWIEIAKLFKKPETEADQKWVDETLVDLASGCYTLHLWNRWTKELKIEEGNVVAKLIAEHCTI